MVYYLNLLICYFLTKLILISYDFLEVKNQNHLYITGLTNVLLLFYKFYKFKNKNNS